MKFPLPWLKQYLPLSQSVEEISDILTMLGIEVEGVKDEIFEVSLTPNLAHCFSVRGIARELSAALSAKVESQPISVKECSDRLLDQEMRVDVEEKEDCPRYACRLITDVKVGPSPAWLQEALEKSGLRSVNNVVDATNYVMLDIGQPLHAFDFDTLEQRRIVVRKAKKGESIVTLDEKTHRLREQTLVICDGKGPIAIAGVMGSLAHEVSEKSRNVLLESAYFSPTVVRRASKELGIHTEASHRFERGVDPQAVIEALDRAAELIRELSGGHVATGRIDAVQKRFEPKEVSVRLSRVNQLLGTHLAMSEVETILQRLSLEIKKREEDRLTVSVPTFRHDISHEIDLVEEVARLYGFENIRPKGKIYYRNGVLLDSPLYTFENKVRKALLQEGLQELLTCDLISPEQVALIEPDCMPQRDLVKLLNPRSQDQSVLRPSFLPSMLEVVRHNAHFSEPNVCGFEIGRVHFKTHGELCESTLCSLVLSGNTEPQCWQSDETPVDFFTLKGVLESFFKRLAIKGLHFEKSSYKNFHPHRQASICSDGHELGIMGEMHPHTLQKADIVKPLYFAEICLEDLIELPEEKKMQPLPIYPASTRDWTVTLPRKAEIASLCKQIEKARGPLLEEVSLLDVYLGENIGSDLKNVTFRFTYRDPEQTVSVEAVENEHTRMTQEVMNT